VRLCAGETWVKDDASWHQLGSPLELTAVYVKSEKRVNGHATELLEAVKTNELLQVEEILCRGQRTDATDPNGVCALCFAAQQGNEDMLQLLLEAKAQVDGVQRDLIQDAVGPAHRGFSMVQRPLCFAAHGGHSQCLQLLLAAHANGNLRETGAGTALHAAAHPEGTACVQLLLAKNCKANQQDVQFRTPLYLAAASSALEVMDLLLAAKASPWMPNRKQQTPLHVLREAGGVEKLLRARAGVNEQATSLVA